MDRPSRSRSGQPAPLGRPARSVGQKFSGRPAPLPEMGVALPADSDRQEEIGDAGQRTPIENAHVPLSTAKKTRRTMEGNGKDIGAMAINSFYAERKQKHNRVPPLSISFPPFLPFLFLSFPLSPR